MTTRRLWCPLALLLLAPAAAAHADPGATDAPLPKGAKVRLGSGLCVRGAQLLPPDYRTALVGGWGLGRPHVFDIRTGKATAVPGFDSPDPGRHADGRTIMAVSADGKRAVTERAHNQYLVFEVATGTEVGTAPLNPGFRGVSLSADGKVLAFAAGGKDGGTSDVVVWSVDKAQELGRATGLKGRQVQTVLSPDGKALLTSVTSNSNQTDVRLWDGRSGKLIAALPSDQVGPAAFSPDGKTLATADAGCGAVQLWDAATGKPGALLLGRSDRLSHLTFAPDGKTLAGLAANGAVERWSVPDGKRLKSTPFPAADLLPYPTFSGAHGVAYLDNDRAVAWGTLWEATLVWEVPGGKLLTPFAGHVGAVTAVRFASGGKDVLTAGVDRCVYRWDGATGRRTAVVAGPPPAGLAFDHLTSLPYRHLSPDGRRGLRDRALFDVAAGEEVLGLPVTAPTPSDDFRRVAGLGWGRGGGKSGSAYEVWDVEARRRVARLPVPETVFRPQDGAVAFSPDGSRLVAAVPVSEPGMQPLLVVGWDVATGKALAEVREPMQGFTFGDQNRPQLAASANNSGVVLATADGKLWVADYERGVRGETLAELTVPQRFACPTFRPDGKAFAVGAPTDKPDAYEVRVYDWPRGRLAHTFAGHTAPVTALAFSPDGKVLAAGSADGSTLLWDAGAVAEPK